MINLTAVQIDAISAWAENTPPVTVVRLYGSRAKGLARSDSDIDLALTIETKCSRPSDDDGYTAYFFGKDRWQADLARLTNLPVHIERYHPITHPHVFEFCDQCSIIIWERAGTDTVRAHPTQVIVSPP